MKIPYLLGFALFCTAAGESAYLAVKTSFPSCIFSQNKSTKSGSRAMLYMTCDSRYPAMNPCCNSADDSWKLDYGTTTDHSKYKMHNANMCLDAGPPSAWKNGAPITFTPCGSPSATAGQLWTMTKDYGTGRTLRLWDSDGGLGPYCLDLQDGKMDGHGAGLMQLWQCQPLAALDYNQRILQSGSNAELLKLLALP